MGISRSTAAMTMLLAQAHPEEPEAEIAGRVRAIRPIAWPNLRMIEMADDALDRGGRLVAAAAGLYAGNLARRPDRPTRIVCTDTSAERLDHLRLVHADGGLDPAMLAYEVVGGAADGDRVVGAATPGSLVINATGLGKDRPGSPLTDAVRFPAGGLVWELNYRGSLELLHQARAQQDAAGLTVVDGWRYFIHGWSQVVAEVFGLTLDAATVEELAALAEDVR